MSNLNLLGTTTRVETPFIKVTIGDYTFGVYDKKQGKNLNIEGIYQYNKIVYPNFIQSLNVQKINGQVNTYTLNIIYPITDKDDPNFFEKVFSSVSDSRKIKFSYGDLSTPNYIYKDEEAIITAINSQFSVSSCSITYNITAVSSSSQLNSGKYTFPGKVSKPSDLIKNLLYDNSFGLLDIFYGMKNKILNERYNLIPDTDIVVSLETKYCSPLDYLTYLVSCMVNSSDSDKTKTTSLIKSKSYILTVIDDVSGIFNGPYFKITLVDKNNSISNLQNIYEIDINYPSKDIVTNFSINNNDNYSIMYNYANKITDEVKAPRIDDLGNIVYTYAPAISSTSEYFNTTENERTWWTNIVQFPLSATITFKGLLKPAILMTHVKLNVYFYGRKHISSGVYIITKQNDSIDFSGFKTTLQLTRIAGDEYSNNIK